MKHVFINFLLLIAVLLSAACSSHYEPNSDGSYSVRIPIDDGQNHFVLKTVRLTTVNDLSSMSGSVSKIKMGGDFRKVFDAQGNGYAEFETLGTVPQAHFIKSNGVYYPADYDTLLMTTASYHFERIKEFYDVDAMNANLSFPRVILLNLNTSAQINEETQVEFDNAGYLPGVDLFLVQPYRSDYIPPGMNGGVLGHEYFHSVFTAIMQEASVRSHAGLDTWTQPSFQEQNLPVSRGRAAKPGPPFSLTEQDTTIVNNYILSSFNEGLADFFGYLYSHNADYGEASLHSNGLRSLSVTKRSEIPAALEDQKVYLFSNVVKAPSGEKLDEHVAGAAFAHFLYLISQQWGEVETRKLALTFSQNYATLFMQNSKNKKRFIPLYELINLFFKDKQASGRVCDILTEIYPAEMAQETIPCDRASTL